MKKALKWVIIVAVILASLRFCLVFLKADDQKPIFTATVLAVEGSLVTAQVTSDEIAFPLRGLGDIMVFDMDEPVEPGDRISGIYRSGTIDGDYVGLVSYGVEP